MDNIVSELFKDKPPSEIPLEKPVIPPKVEVNPSNFSSLFWAQLSQNLLNSYKTGQNYAKFGNNKKTTSLLFQRLGDALIDAVKQDCSKVHISSDLFASHFTVLEAILDLIARDIERYKLPPETVEDILAHMHGFIEEYSKQVLGLGDRSNEKS